MSWIDRGAEIERLQSDLAQARKEAEGYRKALQIAREALDTYSQFADKGETAFVSGRLARDALKAIGEKGEKDPG